EGYEDTDNTRLANTVYSGDIITLQSGSTIMQRGATNSQVIFDTPLPKIGTNLSKIRLVLAGKMHDPRKQTPIRYTDSVYLKHNAIINNQNENRYIKYGDTLQSHQDGP